MSNSRDELLAGLSSNAPSERARAAAWLLVHTQDISTRELVQALQAETVPQVRRVLLEVLERRQKASVASKPAATNRVVPPDGEEAAASEASADAGEIASMVRHELAPAIGWIRLAADAEIPGFATSRTNDAVRRLQLRIDGLVTLIKSRTDLDLRVVDLPLELASSWPDPTITPRISPTPPGSTAHIDTDQGLFALLMSNIYQNAIDASVDATGVADVDVTWGVTDQSFWVRVTNPFRGQRLTFEDVAPIGFSSKAGHQGRGLALIQKIAALLDIVVALDGASGTASFVVNGQRHRG